MKNENLENMDLQRAISFLKEMSTQDIREIRLEDYAIKVYEMMIGRLYTEAVSGRERVRMAHEECQGTIWCGSEHAATRYSLDGAEWSLKCTENSLKDYQNRLNDLKMDISNQTQLTT